MKGILGRKVGMTQVFTTSGKLIPVTVVEVEENIVTQIKTVEKDGYNSIQLGAFTKREKIANKPETGHAKKANTEPKRFLKEIKNIDVSNYEVGQGINASIFEKGEIVDVTGTSKGKGFQGVIKRWNQSRGPMTHGSHYHRGVGSLGTMLPMRVLKGKKLPGHMGHEQVTIQNLEIIDVDLENNCILVSGNIPGPKNSYVLIREAIKSNGKKKEAKDLVSYIVEEVTEEKETTTDTEETIENTEVIEEETKSEENVEAVENKEETVEENTTEEEKEEVEEPAREEENTTEKNEGEE